MSDVRGLLSEAVAVGGSESAPAAQCLLAEWDRHLAGDAGSVRGTLGDVLLPGARRLALALVREVRGQGLGEKALARLEAALESQPADAGLAPGTTAGTAINPLTLIVIRALIEALKATGA